MSLLILQDTELQETLTDIQNFNMELEFEVKSQGYLGEKTNRKDYIFNGCKFDFEIHVHTQDVFAFIRVIHDKAQRLTPNVQFNLMGIFSFPNGDTPELLLSDCAWGAMPMNVGSRGDYVKFKMQGECGDIDLQPST